MKSEDQLKQQQQHITYKFYDSKLFLCIDRYVHCFLAILGQNSSVLFMLLCNAKYKSGAKSLLS